jgi:hypothetical protein
MSFLFLRLDINKYRSQLDAANDLLVVNRVHISHHPAPGHNKYNRIGNQRQCKAVRTPEDGRKHARKRPKHVEN